MNFVNVVYLSVASSRYSIYRERSSIFEFKATLGSMTFGLFFDVVVPACVVILIPVFRFFLRILFAKK